MCGVLGALCWKPISTRCETRFWVPPMSNFQNLHRRRLQEIEGTNNTLQHIGRLSPKISWPLISARIMSKKMISQLRHKEQRTAFVESCSTRLICGLPKRRFSPPQFCLCTFSPDSPLIDDEASGKRVCKSWVGLTVASHPRY